MPDITLDPNDPDEKILAQVVAYYHASLKEAEPALQYLRDRGITCESVIDHFRIGYSDRSLGLTLPGNRIRAGAAIRNRLQKLGLYRGSGHEHFRGSLTFPIHSADGSGQITDIYGRKIQDGHLRKGTALHTWLNDDRKGVFNVAGFGTGEVVLCASVFDALTFWNAGYRNTTAMFGPDALTDDILAAFAEFNVRRVLTTSEKVVERLLTAGLETFLVRLPLGVDVNLYARQVNDPADALGELLRHAEWVGKGRAVSPTTTKPPHAINPDKAEAVVKEERKPPAPEQSSGSGPVSEGRKSRPRTPAPARVSEGRKSSATRPARKILPSLTEATDGSDEPVGEGREPPAPNILPSLPDALAELLDADDEDEPALEDDDEDTHEGCGVVVEPEQAEPEAVAEPPVRTASPVPTPPPSDEATVAGDEVVLVFGTRRYRVRGLEKNQTRDVLRVNVLVSNGVGMYLDTFDLYAAKHRKAFQEQAAVELHVEEKTIKADLGKVLLKLEELQDARLVQAERAVPRLPDMTEQERADALALLRDPHLLDRIVADFQVVGERTNKLMGYLAAVSRKLDQPLAVLIQSTSAAGKTTLMEAVLAFCPPEDVVKFSAMTGQSLYYMADDTLKHRILAIVEEEGAARASYALKLLQSEGELRIASTGKDGHAGRLTTQEYKVEGPTMLFLTTTSIDVDEELLNRCVVLTVDEDREQTRAIHALQRRHQTLGGMLAAREHDRVLALHRNAQRLLRPLLVVNPFAERLTFLDARTRTRRDHQKYLTLIRVVTLLHQHQRPVRTVEHRGQAVEFIEVTVEDIAVANELAAEVLGRCLDDLPPQTRSLLALLDQFVGAACKREGIDRADYRFTRREVREHTGWGDTQLKLHLKRLVDLEYLLLHRDRTAKRHCYELLYSGVGEGRAMPGLLDVALLNHKYDDDRSGFGGDRSGHGRPSVGPRSGGGRGSFSGTTPTPPAPCDRTGRNEPEIVPPPSSNGVPS